LAQQNLSLVFRNILARVHIGLFVGYDVVGNSYLMILPSRKALLLSLQAAASVSTKRYLENCAKLLTDGRLLIAATEEYDTGVQLVNLNYDINENFSHG